MKSWTLKRISGSTPEVRDYCRQIYFFFTRTTDSEYFRLSPRGGRTSGTFRRFHDKIKRISRRYPDDVLTLQYYFRNSEDSAGEIHIIEYKNGVDTTVSIEPAANE